LIAATHTAAGAIVFYVNGGVANSRSSVANPLQTFAVPLVWGRLGNDASEAWNGRIIASGIHSVVLTAEEIRTLYAEPFAMIVPPTSTKQATPSGAAPATTGTAEAHGISQLATISSKGAVSVVSLRAEGRVATDSAKQSTAIGSVRSQSRLAFVVSKAISYTVSLRGLAEITAPGTQGGVTTVGLRAEGRVATATIKGGVSAPTHRAEGRLSIQSISERTSAAFYRALADLRITSTSGQTSTGAASLRGAARFAVTGVRGAISTVELHSPTRGALASAKQLATTVTMRAASRAVTLISTARSGTASIRSKTYTLSTGVTAVVEIFLTVAASGQAIATGIGSTLVQRFRNRVRYTLRNNPTQTSEYRNPPTGRDRDSTHRR
jgi:hypothetical protein